MDCEMPMCNEATKKGSTYGRTRMGTNEGIEMVKIKQIENVQFEASPRRALTLVQDDLVPVNPCHENGQPEWHERSYSS